MENFLGEIRLFAGNFAPAGWAFCDGTLLSISQNSALYALIGTTYGGDGQNTFALPDLRGRLPIGQGGGPGLSSRVIGQTGGEEGHTLVTAEMPAHAHTVTVSTADASSITPTSSELYGTVIPPNPNPNGVLGLYTNAVPPDVPAVQMAPQAVANNGGGQPHDNTMPTLTINYIIATEGIFPSRS